MKLGIIAASMLVGAASLVSVSAHAQTSQTLVVPKSAVPQAGRVSPDKPKPSTKGHNVSQNMKKPSRRLRPTLTATPVARTTLTTRLAARPQG